MLVHWIWLSTRSGMSEREKYILLRHFEDPEDIFYEKHFDVKPDAKESLLDKDLSAARKILDDCADLGIHICTLQDAAYPARLKNIADPPLVLYYKGRLPDFDSAPAVAIVGTRKASAYGLSTAQKMGYQIAKCGAIVVTGLAGGIDGAGAKGALMADGTVVGVLGCGADKVYPAYHKSLYADTEHQGCLITEFPPHTPPFGWNFPKRNRIMSGLSNGVLVVEAPEKSGALITARDAAEQGRDVFCVPGNIDVETFAGSNALLRDGATPVFCGWDVVSEYQGLYGDKVHPFTAVDYSEKSLLKVAQKPLTPDKSPSFDRKKEKKPIDKTGKQPYSDIHDALTPEQRKIVDLLKNGEKLLDEIIAESGMSAQNVSSVVTMLQIKGIISKKAGNILSLK